MQRLRGCLSAHAELKWGYKNQYSAPSFVDHAGFARPLYQRTREFRSSIHRPECAFVACQSGGHLVEFLFLETVLLRTS